MTPSVVSRGRAFSLLGQKNGIGLTVLHETDIRRAQMALCRHADLQDISLDRRKLTAGKCTKCKGAGHLKKQETRCGMTLNNAELTAELWGGARGGTNK